MAMVIFSEIIKGFVRKEYLAQSDLSFRILYKSKIIWLYLLYLDKMVILDKNEEHRGYESLGGCRPFDTAAG